MKKKKVETGSASIGKSGSGKPATKIQKIEILEEDIVAPDDLDSKVNHFNQPVLMSVFKDPVTEQEKVIVLVILPVGATDVSFTLFGTGPGTRLARIYYSWPPIAFEIEALFQEEIDSDALPSCHPKILALTEDLKFTRENIGDVPIGAMEFTLPIPVQTAGYTLTRTGVLREDNSLALIVEMSAYQNSYTIKAQDTKIVFKKFADKLTSKLD